MTATTSPMPVVMPAAAMVMITAIMVMVAGCCIDAGGTAIYGILRSANYEPCPAIIIHIIDDGLREKLCILGLHVNLNSPALENDIVILRVIHGHAIVRARGHARSRHGHDHSYHGHGRRLLH